MKHAKAVRRIIFTVLIVAAVIVGFNTYTADFIMRRTMNFRQQRYRRRMPTSLTEIRRVRWD